ncbi:MAG TPA: hypothetical protein VFB14_18325 [Bryobacteraceae bacterium]|jgi:hypothetical protein|nr:hypothetical protein [Bryobacteraceae bacterium]
MKHRIAVSGAVLALLFSTAGTGLPQTTTVPSKIEVQVRYSGSGTVDQKHKIYVVVWDSPDFVKGQGVTPAAIQPTSSKDGVVTFNDVTKTPAYVSAAYDPSGQWDAQSPPPEGSSLGLYSKTPGTPAPIELKPGKTVSIELPFDDSVKMKGGQATR